MRDARTALRAGVAALAITVAACSSSDQDATSRTGSSVTSASTPADGPDQTAGARAVRVVQGSLGPNGDATVDAVFAVDSAAAESEAGPYELVFMDEAGTELSSVPFDVTRPVEEGGSEVDPIFVVTVTDPGPTAQRLEVRRDGQVIGSLESEGTPPEVVIDRPAEGAALTGDEVDVSWTTTGASDGAQLRHIVQYQQSTGSQWSTLSTGTSADAWVFLDELGRGSSGTIRVTVSSGFDSASADVDVTVD